MRCVLLATLLLLAAGGGSKPDPAERKAAERAVRMKTTRQLKEILNELSIKVPKDADKEDLMEYGCWQSHPAPQDPHSH